MMARLLTVFILIVATPALACDCVRLIPGGPHFDRDIAAIVDDATVIAEGVLIAPDTFRATRVLKGPRRARYTIGLPEGVVSDCTLYGRELDARIGEPTVIVLRGGPEHYEVSRCSNYQSRAVENAIRRRLGFEPSRRGQRVITPRVGWRTP
jgi:hypothetical protein